MNIDNAVAPHRDFILQKRREIAALKLEVLQYLHPATGASHIHLAANHPENVFMVVLRTVPENSNGVAHVLEHTALCGSKKFPVRDPFFLMLRRSLNTFMNAFTGSDWTAYPFATLNRKDFDNLLQVYLDAVFFPLLEPMDFAQEGHRIEFSEPGNRHSELIRSGVVYNEMKGAMSAVSDQIHHTVCKHLYPDTTYRHNSGGEPTKIPQLDHAQLLAFHRRHYHPSNATFMTFGDIEPAHHQQLFVERVLDRFPNGNGAGILVPREQRFSKPRAVTDSYACDDDSNKTHLLCSWLLGEGTDLKHVVEMGLLNGVLLDNSASPLRQVLEQTDLGDTPSQLCGLMGQHRELVFSCGIEGSEEHRAEEFKTLILDSLQHLVQHGVDRELVESMLYQFEVHKRKISGGRFPYGLQCLLGGLSAVLYRGDVIDALDMDKHLQYLHKSCQNPDFIPELIQKNLLDNPHQLWLTMQPDRDGRKNREEQEKQQLAAIREQLSDREAKKVIQQTQQLHERQQQQDNPEILPRLVLADVPQNISSPQPLPTGHGGEHHHRYTAATNGLVYQQLIVDIPELDEQELRLLPLYTEFLTEVGCADRDYLSMQRLQAAVCGSLNASYGFGSGRKDEQQTRGRLTLAGMGLERTQQKMTRLMYDTLTAARFDELPRLRELLSVVRSISEQSVTDQGHLLAMKAAVSAMSPSASLTHRLDGLEGIRFTRQLSKQIDADESEIELLAERLNAIHSKVRASRHHSLLVCEQQYLDTADRYFPSPAATQQEAPLSNLTFSPLRDSTQQLWRVDSQVNFCARAWPTVPKGHQDAPLLSVLAEYLRHGFLHRQIRESGGAYGGGARYQPNAAAFCCYSYRDPRCEETLEDFDQSLQWLQQQDSYGKLLEESILSVVANLDKPGSPAGEAIADCHRRINDYTPELHRIYRQAVLNATESELRRVAKQWLTPESSSTAVVVPMAGGQSLLDGGLTLHHAVMAAAVVYCQ